LSRIQVVMVVVMMIVVLTIAAAVEGKTMDFAEHC
jgi:hypothetical protein